MVTQSGDRRIKPMAALSTAFLYGSVSVATTLSTKLVVSGFGFKYTALLVLFEKIVIIMVMVASPSMPRPREWLSLISKTHLLSIISLLNALVSITSLEGLNIPMYNCLKRLTSLVTLITEAMILKKRSSLPVQVSIVLITAGALIAGAHDYDLNLRSYSWALLSCILNALHLTLAKQASTTHALSSSALVLTTSIASIPLLLLYSSASGELAAAAASFPAWRDPRFAAALAASVLLGSSLGYTQFLCTAANSALTTTVVGQMKMVLSTLLGVLAFGTTINVMQGAGLALNTAGGCYFAWCKHIETSATVDSAYRGPKATGPPAVGNKSE